jgi:putative endonuclease
MVGYVYILGNQRPTLYIGITNDLIKRVWQHKQELVEGFSRKYHLHKLLYYEKLDTIEEAIKREKQLKNWRREWKLDLIKSQNPKMKDLYSEII